MALDENLANSMESISNKVDILRDELVKLLRSYAYAPEKERYPIYRRAEFLGGEIDELANLLKYCAILNVRETNLNPDEEYRQDVIQLSGKSLKAIEEAKIEVMTAIHMLRESYASFELSEDDWSEYFYASV